MISCFKSDANAVNAFAGNVDRAFKAGHAGVITTQDRNRLLDEFSKMAPPTQEAALKQLDAIGKSQGGVFASGTVRELKSELAGLKNGTGACVADSLSLKPISDRGSAAVAREINQFRKESAELQQRIMDARIEGRAPQ